MKQKFIKTSDESTAILLRECGLQELQKEDGKWVFINDQDKLVFADSKTKKCFSTDILHF